MPILLGHGPHFEKQGSRQYFKLKYHVSATLTALKKKKKVQMVRNLNSFNDLHIAFNLEFKPQDDTQGSFIPNSCSALLPLPYFYQQF